MPARIIAPVVDLLRTPDGSRDRQLVMGEDVTILHTDGDHRLIRAGKDGYHGYLKAKELGPPGAAAYRVTARSTQTYRDPDIKSPDRQTLSFGSRLILLGETASFIETDMGFVPRQHVHPIDAHGTDPAAIATVFLGTPYLWGGNSGFGIDCSGLVQAALLACQIPCPGDSDQQEQRLGERLPENAPYQRNDLIFWRGHVALVSDPQTLIHANAGHMTTMYEPIKTAITRIDQQGDGQPTAHKRIVLSSC